MRFFSKWHVHDRGICSIGSLQSVQVSESVQSFNSCSVPVRSWAQVIVGFCSVLIVSDLYYVCLQVQQINVCIPTKTICVLAQHSLNNLSNHVNLDRTRESIDLVVNCNSNGCTWMWKRQHDKCLGTQVSTSPAIDSCIYFVSVIQYLHMNQD